MNTYNMRLLEEPFNKIKSGEKKLELRLNDNKRKEIKLGDLIEFTTTTPAYQGSITVRVVGLTVFNSFYDLFNYVDLSLLGKENLSITQRISNILKIYSEQREKEHGVLGIYIQKL